MNRVADQVASRGIIIIISDLLTELDAFYNGLGRLQHQGHEIVIFQILDPDEIDLPFDDSMLFRDIEETRSNSEGKIRRTSGRAVGRFARLTRRH